MKLASWRFAGRENFGLVLEGGLLPLRDQLAGKARSLREALQWGLLGDLGTVVQAQRPTVGTDEVEFLPLIPDPGKFLAVGLNYRSHAAEVGRVPGARPSMFSRFTDTLVGHDQPMVIPRISTQLDFEGELAVVMASGGRYIPERGAMSHIAGYTCFLDGSVRDFQKDSVTAGKNFPTTGPLGPWLVTADEISDPASLSLTTRLNGEVMQHSSLADLIHPVAALVSYASQFTQLAPGDVIATGTPAGVGHGRTPEVWLQVGDVVEVEVSAIGTLRTYVIAEQ